MRKFKYALLVTLIIGAATLADGIEVLRVEGIEVLSTGESIVMTHVGHHPMAATLQAVMVMDGIEVLVMQMPVPPEGGMFPVHFPIHQLGNRIELCDPCGNVVDYLDALELD
jgi:hypothetical protein